MTAKICSTCLHDDKVYTDAPCATCSKGTDTGTGLNWVAKPGEWHPVTPEEAPSPTPVSLDKSDGSTASYYELPAGARELQDLIAFRDMNAQLGEIFRACYRYGMVEHSPKIRDIKKIIFYAQAELARLEKYEGGNNG